MTGETEKNFGIGLKKNQNVLLSLSPLNLLNLKTNTNTSPVDDPSDPSFVCERVCASPRLLRRMGGLSRDATPSSCVTVCGAVQEDACAEACQRAVCASLHQVPAWNDACLKRCTTECTRGRAG